jgi:predicted kinase
MIVVVCGVPGVGKTTVAETVADRLDGELLRTDVIRKERYEAPSYTAEETQAVYDELLDSGVELAASGHDVVFDGTFRRAERRRAVVERADAVGVGVEFVEVECEEAVVKDRIESRTDDESDADFEVHLAIKSEFESLSADHYTIDNSTGLDSMRAAVAEHF